MDKFKAIVVDDEASVCEAVRAILELEGIEVTTFYGQPGRCRRHQTELLRPHHLGPQDAEDDRA